jgi:succinyl-CoA synthetase alpha subunit
MSIFIDRNTRVLVQGITGSEGSFWTKHMIDLGTQVVCGVTPSKEGQTIHDIPVYHSVERALRNHQVDASMIFVPPKLTKDAVFEALSNGIKKSLRWLMAFRFLTWSPFVMRHSNIMRWSLAETHPVSFLRKKP